MKKINFENKPSTNSPINATNLDLLQDNVEDDIGLLSNLNTIDKSSLVNTINEINTKIQEKNIITASLSDNYTTQSTAAETLEISQMAKIGDKLSITSDGGILIGEGINNVLISGQVIFSSPVNNSRLACFIYKNSTASAQNVVRANGTLSFQGVSVSPFLLSVVQGDIIYLKARSQDDAGAVVFGNEAGTYITVNAIN